MAVFDLTDASAFGLRISDPDAAGVLSLIGGMGRLTLIADDEAGATFKIDDNPRADKVFMSYDVERGRVRLKDVVFVDETPEDVLAVFNLDLLTRAGTITEAARTAHLNAGKDQFFGGDDRDLIRGGGGKDSISSYEGDDVVLGGAGDDRLDAFGGADRLKGEAGDDTLLGGLGRDILSGGEGQDTFVFGDPAESVAGDQRDVIKGFDHRKDTIDLSGIDTRSDARGDQPFGWIGEQDFTGHAGQLRFSGKVLQADLDGDRTADFEVRVAGTVSPVDFIF